ncbi:hypothetical protein VNO78_22496 [Psophocarpus tetragonolobus]|uniref:Uncharacterized protein n=1 Tax=Psophocarpus tetragonolobus TaxID=3891 RepID=A0AAN9XCM4_PSOTE
MMEKVQHLVVASIVVVTVEEIVQKLVDIASLMIVSPMQLDKPTHPVWLSIINNENDDSESEVTLKQ